MNVLFCICAGSGDLINFTGCLRALSALDIYVDLLIPRAMSYIVYGNPYVRTILYAEDFGIFEHASHNNFDVKMRATFGKKYSKVINLWRMTDDVVRREISKCGYLIDYTSAYIKVLKSLWPALSLQRDEANPAFYYTEEDLAEIDRFLAILPKQKICLVETDCKSWHKNSDHLAQIRIPLIKEAGYYTIGNHAMCDANTASINLKNISRLYDKYCSAFVGVCGSTTCAVFANQSMQDKKMIIEGYSPGWNLFTYLKSKPQKFLFKTMKFSDADLVNILR